MPLGDSISKYDGSRDLYSTRLTPLQQKRVSTSEGGRSPGKVDTIATAKEKTERYSPIGLFPRGNYLFGDQVLKIARAGRFVFFAFAVPPFFLFYTLPKWIGLTLVLPLVAIVEKKLDYGKKFIQQMFKYINEAALRPFRNFLGKISWKNTKIEKQGSSLLSYLGQNFQKIGEKIENIYKHITTSLDKTAILPLKNALKVVKQKIGEIIKDSKDVYSKISNAMTSYGKNIYHSLQTVIQPAINLFSPALQYIQKPFSLAFGWGREVLNENIRPALKSALEKVKELAGNASNKITHVYTQITQIVQPVLNYLAMAPLQFLKKHLGFGLQWLKQKPREQFERFARFAQGIIGRIAPHLNKTLDGLLGKSAGFWRWIFGCVYKGIAFVFRKIINILKDFYRFFKNTVLKSHDRLYKSLSFCKRQIFKGYNFFIDQVKAIIEAPVVYFTNLFKKILFFFLKVLRFCALVVIAIFLVFRFWFKMLYELSETITNRR